jgi:hypothetical protein
MKKVTTVTPVLSGVAHGLSRQRGASLLEGIAYLGIAAIVVLGAVSLLTNAFSSAKSNQTTEELISLRTSVRKLYAGQAYPAAGIVANMVIANAIPNTLIVDRTANPATITNGWAGAVTIIGDGAGLFTITYNAVPQDVCMSIVSGANGWERVSNAAGAGAIAAFPITANDAAGVCAAATNVLEFRAT